ncbi:MAG TPA: hypothetical protein VNA16_00810, partial [Abditibacteriaceae bacterium]|nr:hypothetical protein [Abditibacteriaceae bacterium]
GDSAELWMTDPAANVARGQLLAFAPDCHIKVVAAETRNAYDAPVTLCRTLLVTEDYVLDRFQCRGESHRWDYALHPSAAVETSLELQNRDGVLGVAHGMKEVRNVRDAVLPGAGTQLFWGGCAAWVWCSTPARLALGTNPAPQGKPNVTLVLTQFGEDIDYCSLFYRRSFQPRVAIESDRVRLATESFADSVSFTPEGVLWQRQESGGRGFEERVLNRGTV